MRPTTGLSRRCALGVAAIVGGVVTVIVRAGVGVLGLGLGWGLAFGFGSGVDFFCPRQLSFSLVGKSYRLSTERSSVRFSDLHDLEPALIVQSIPTADGAPGLGAQGRLKRSTGGSRALMMA